MLVEFRVKNFKSFRDEQVLSMVASKDDSLADTNLITSDALGKQRLLRSAVLYGANASGKSNLIAAIDFVRMFVTESAQRSPGTEIPVQPFRLATATAQAPSEFELTFIREGIRYQYGFSVDRKQVHSEWLIAYPKGKPQTWFERKKMPRSEKFQWHFGSKLKGDKGRLTEVTRPDALFLSVAARFNQPQLLEVYGWFSAEVKTLRPDRQDGLLHEQLVAMVMKKHDAIYRTVNRLIQLADLGIAEIFIEKVPQPFNVSPETMNWPPYEIRVKHKTNKNVEDDVVFTLEDESRGTQRLFSISWDWLFALVTGSIVLADELDVSLHPTMVRGLISLFHNSGMNHDNAQVLFNTHDTTLLDTSIFRRDQIWFVEKDNDGASHLYSLLEYSPRKDEALEKGYLQGRYGAIPFLGDLAKGLQHNGKA